MYAAVPRMMPASVRPLGMIVGELARPGPEPLSARRAPVGGEDLRQTEIQHLDLTVRTNLDVRRLQVAVHDALLVRGFERVRNLRRHRERFIQRGAAAREELGQRLALDELHHECEGAAGLFETVHDGNTRVIERGERARLALESRAPFTVLRERLGQDFDRDVALQPGIASAIHLAHSAGPE